MKPRRPYLTLFLLVALAGCEPSEPSDSSKIKAALDYSRLAPLPASAHHVAVKTSGNMFARVFWLRFSASSGDISAWLAASKSIASDDHGRAVPPAEVTPGCFYNAPAWYRPSDVTRGRLLEVPDEDDTRGWVLIDDDRHDLLICTSHG